MDKPVVGHERHSVTWANSRFIEPARQAQHSVSQLFECEGWSAVYRYRGLLGIKRCITLQEVDNSHQATKQGITLRLGVFRSVVGGGGNAEFA